MFKKISYVVFIFLFFLCAFFAHAEVIMSPEMEVIIEGVKYGDTLISSAIGKVNYEYSEVESQQRLIQEYYNIPDEHVGRYTYPSEWQAFFAFKKSKMLAIDRRIENISSSQNYDVKHPFEDIGIRTWNGEKSQILHFHRELPDGEFRAFGYNHGINRVRTRFNPLRYTAHLFGNDLSVLFNKNRYRNVEYIGTDEFEGGLCKKIRTEVAHSDSVITLWLSPQLSYRAAKVVITTTKFKIVKSFNYKKYNNGLLYPKSCIEKYYGNTENNKEVLFITKKLSVSDDFRINVDVSDSYFSIDYPIGLFVYDTVLSENYFVEELKEE